MEAKEIYDKIISFLRIRGPSLPIHIAKELKMSSLFVSAFLSEMVDSKKIKISNLKVGGSPLYFLNGQESRLESFYNYLHPTEAETFLLLKKSKVLRDSEQQPAIRIALREIKDFAISFNFNNEIFWKYFLVSEQEVNMLLKEISEKVKERVVGKEMKEEVEKEVKKKVIEIKKAESLTSPLIEKIPKLIIERKPKKEFKEGKEVEITEFENPLVIQEKKKENVKPKSNFVLRIIEFIKENNFKIIEEKEYKAREYNCIVEVKSQLGIIKFFTLAKDKKTISDKELKKLVSDAQKIPLPALMFYSGKLSKKSEEFLERYNSILKAVKVE